MCAENGGWILQSKKPSVTQGSCRGGGLEYSNGWLAESWQWLCDLSQPVGTRALCSGHDNKESVAWNWRTWVPLFLPAGKPGWSSPWGQTSMQVEGKKKVPTTLSWELSITEEQLYVTIIYTSQIYLMGYFMGNYYYIFFILCLKCQKVSFINRVSLPCFWTQGK